MKRNLIIYLLVILSIFSLYGCDDIFQFVDDNVTIGGDTDINSNGNSNGDGGDTETDGNGNSNGDGGDADTDSNGNSNGSGGDADIDGNGNSNSDGSDTDIDGNGNSNGSGGGADTDGNGNSNGSGGDADTDGNGNSNGDGSDTDIDSNGNSNGDGSDTDTDSNGNSNGDGGDTETDGNGNSNGDGGDTETDGNGNSNGDGGDTDTDGNGNSNGDGGDTDIDGDGNSNGDGGDTDIDGDGNNNGDGGDTGTDGNDNGETDLNKLRYLFRDSFGDNPNGMYFALHITGKSKIIPARQTGVFKQPASSLFKTPDIYARDLTFSYIGDKIDEDTLELFSKTYQEDGLADIYNIEYGWTNENGTILNMPFYYGNERFYIPQNKLNKDFKFRTFSLKDFAVKGFLGETTTIVCREGHDFKIQSQVIDISKYNPDIHKNIALLTLDFTDTCTYTFTFDGFVEK